MTFGLPSSSFTISTVKKDSFFKGIFAFASIILISLSNLVSGQTNLHIRVFLEGPYTGGSMATTLNFTGQIPFKQPYGIDPWNYFVQDRVNEIPSENIVDWVLVDLLQPVIVSNDTMFQIIDRRAGFLMNDGYIKDLDGISDLQFLATHNPGFYIKISHRNHIPLLSAQAVPFTGGLYNYDFTLASNFSVGGSQSIKQVPGGSWAMISGDGDGNFSISNKDKNEVWLPEQGSNGYYSGDFNNDGMVNIDDKLINWGINSGMGYEIDVACCVPTTNFKHIYLANDNHTDYFWSGTDIQYRDVFINELDYYLDLADQTQNNPLPYQSRYNCDGAIYVYTYKNQKTDTEFNRLISRIKDGHISMPYNMFASTYGGQPTEAVIRGMYWQEKLARDYNLDIKMAGSMENQTLPLGLASLWAGSGVKYSWKGVCGCASNIGNSKLQNRSHEIYKYLGPDETGVVMKWYSLSELYGNNGQGGYAEARIPSNSISEMSDKCNSTSYPYHIAGAFGHGHDALQKTTSTFVSNAQNGSNTNQQVYVSNEEDFFDHFLSLYPQNNLPVESVSYGNEWDVDCATMAGPTADVRKATEALRSAEAMSAVICSVDPTFYEAEDINREKAWIALGSYWEHDFGIGGCCTDERGDWQLTLRNNITGFVDSLTGAAIQRLESLITKTGTKERFFVFNPLGWQRSGVADLAYSGSSNISVIDLTSGLETPHQLIVRNGQQYLRVFASELPSVGYKVFEIDLVSSANTGVTADFDGSKFENDFYQLTITSAGVITGFQDKNDNNREYVLPDNGRYVNDFGQGISGTGTITLLDNGPVSATIQCISSFPMQHTSLITLYKSINRVDIENTIDDDFGDDVQTYSFSFDVQNSIIRHEELGAILTADYKSNGGDYAEASEPVNYRWLTLNHFASVDNGVYGITLSNSGAAFMKPGNSSTDFLDAASSQINVLIGGRMGGSGPGLANQFGNTVFKNDFALKPHTGGFSPTDAMKFSMEHQNKPLVSYVDGAEGGLPSDYYEFVTLDDTDKLLWWLKPAEDGYEEGGLIGRVWNMDSTQGDCILDFDLPVNSAKITTHLETNLEELVPVNGNLLMQIGKNNMKTFRVRFSEIDQAH